MKNDHFFYILSFLLAVFFVSYLDAQELEEEYCQSLEVYQQESNRQAALEAEIRDLYVFLIQQKKDIAEAEYKANH